MDTAPPRQAAWPAGLAVSAIDKLDGSHLHALIYGMQPITTVPVGYLMAPIAAATVLNVFLFAWLWRADKEETRAGKSPWYLSVTLIAYFGIAGCFMYFVANRPAEGIPSVFGIAMIGEAMGVLIIYALIYAFITSRGKPFKERAFPMILSLGLLAGMIGATFSQPLR